MVKSVATARSTTELTIRKAASGRRGKRKVELAKELAGRPKGAGKEVEKAGPVQANSRDGRSQGENVLAPTVEGSAKPETFQGKRLVLAKRTEGSRDTPSLFISTWALGFGWMKSQP